MAAAELKTFQSPARRPVDVAALVAQYAPAGRRRRRLQWLRRLALALAVPAAAALAIAAIQGGWIERLKELGRPATDTAQVARMKEMQARLQAEVGAMSAERQKWEAQRLRLEELNAQLDQKLAALETRWQELEQERSLAEAQQQQRVVRAARNQAPAAGPAEGQPRRESSIRTEIVDRELKALAAERAQLSRQQQELEAQRQQLQDLMKRYDDAARAAAKPAAGEPTGAVAAPVTGASLAPDVDEIPESQLLMASNRPVGPEALGNMRGGLSVGNGPEISFGITRSAAVNGVEQFSNSVYVDDLANIAGSGLAGAAQSVLIQSGTGNFVSPDALAAMTGGFGTLIQNTLDSQVIQTRTLIDVSVGNVAGLVSGMGAVDAIGESLSFQRP